MADRASSGWRVQIDWEGRRLDSWSDRVFGRLRARRARRREHRLAREHEEVRRRDRGEPARDRWWDLGGGATSFDEFGLLLLAAAGLAVVALVAVVFVAVLVAGALEVAAVLIIVGAAFLWRTLTRRPWRVVATDGDAEHVWEVVGWRKARRLVRDVESALAAGVAPTAVEPGLLAGRERGPIG